MIKYGIKIWSTDREDFAQALRLYKSKKIDFLEIYIVPRSFELKDLAIFKKIPNAIHCPHFEHNFDVFRLGKKKIKLFREQVIKTADFLKSQFIILHAGTGDKNEIFEKEVVRLSDQRILVENMPKIGLDDSVCFGYSRRQLKLIKRRCGFNICLDFGHAIKSAKSQRLNYKNFIKSLIRELKPFYFHLSGGEQKKEKDEHFNLFEGDFDIRWIKNIIMGLAKEKRNLYLVFEVPKKDGLENSLKNIVYFKEKI